MRALDAQVKAHVLEIDHESHDVLVFDMDEGHASESLEDHRVAGNVHCLDASLVADRIAVQAHFASVAIGNADKVAFFCGSRTCRKNDGRKCKY